MINKYFYIYSLFLFFGCYKISESDLTMPVIEDIPANWDIADYKDDYGINDLWPISEDSTLFYLLESFNIQNKDILLLDIHDSVSEVYFSLSTSDLYPQISISNSLSQGKQNLSAFGLSDDVLSSDSNDDDSGNQSENSGGFITNSNSLRFNSSWQLDLWGKIKDSNTSSYYEFQSNNYYNKYAKASLRSQLIKLYFQSISLRKEILIYEDNLHNLLTLKNIAEKRALEGISNYDEFYLASSKYYLNEASITSLKYNYDRSISRINLLIAQYLNPEQEFLLDDYPISLDSISGLISSNLLERRPDIVSSKNKVISDRLKLKSDKKIFFPSISFNTSAGYSSSSLSKLLEQEFSVWNLGFDILTPIFYGGKIKDNIKISEYNLDASELDYMKAVVYAIHEVDDILLYGNSLSESYEKIAKSEQDMRKALKYALNSYDLGLVDMVYVLNIQENLNSTSIQKNKMLLSKYINRVDLILSLGGTFDYQY